MRSIGNQIFRYRERAGLSQIELARLIEVTPATLSRYENDQRYPSAMCIVKLSKALHVSADIILGIHDDDFNIYNSRFSYDYPNAQFIISKLNQLSIENSIRVLERIDTLLERQNMVDEE